MMAFLRKLTAIIQMAVICALSFHQRTIYGANLWPATAAELQTDTLLLIALILAAILFYMKGEK